MKILFHYHVPYLIDDNGKLFTESLLGVFLDALAIGCSQLTIIGYEVHVTNKEIINYEIISQNIKFYSLGIHDSVPSRLLRFFSKIQLINTLISENDVFILRAPTPISLFLPYIKKQNKLVFYLVGDYSQMINQNGIRNWAISLLLNKVEQVQRRMVIDRFYLANSNKLIETYSKYSDRGVLIRTTTLSENDIFVRNDIIGRELNLLFTGRITKQKGIFDVLKACILLQNNGYKINYHLAGMNLIDKLSKKTEIETLLELAKGTSMEGRVIFHGLKKVGEELNQIYRQSDIYIIASQSDFEGFPRTIWEALANSLPVIACDVGGISHYLTHLESVYFIKPNTVTDIVASIEAIVSNPDLVKTLRENGRKISKENTLNNQINEIIKVLNLNFKNSI